MNAPHKPDLPRSPELPDLAQRPSFFGTGVIYPALLQTDEERKAALERFFELSKFAQPSDGVKMSRDEMHER